MCGIPLFLSLLWRVRIWPWTLREVNSLFASNWESRYTKARYACFPHASVFLLSFIAFPCSNAVSATLNSVAHQHF